MKNMHEVSLGDVAPAIMNQLPEGAFLTVAHGDEVNTMTVGWNLLGRIWNRPICVVPVRFTRFTRELIEKADSFTLSVPSENVLKPALDCCGTKSGRDIDKAKECGLTLSPSTVVASPAVSGCDIVLECRIVYKQTLEPLALGAGINEQYYADSDYHILFYGEVIKTKAAQNCILGQK